MKKETFTVYGYGNGNMKRVSVSATSYADAEAQAKALLPDFPKLSVYLDKPVIGDHSH